MKCLTESEVRTVRSIGQTFFPRGNPSGIDGIDAGVTEYVDSYLARLPVWERTKVRALFAAIEFLPAAASFDKSRRFSNCAQEEREELLDAWESSSVHFRRMAVKALKSLMGLAYVSSGAVAEKLGMEGVDLGTPEEHLKELAKVKVIDLGAAE